MNQGPVYNFDSIELSEYRDLYFSEAKQQIQRLTAALQQLDHAHANQGALEDAFRAAHTLKGMSATMGYDTMVAAAHAIEDLLQSIRQRTTGATASNLFFLFRAVEDVNQSFSQLQASELPASNVKPEAETLTTESGYASVEVSPFIRVGVEQLDQLNELALRLLASASQLPDDIAETRTVRLRQAQELIAATRQLYLAPLGDVFNRYPRMLYDLARVQGKELRVNIEGADVQVGRDLLEDINEILLHLLRNAVAHGIEQLVMRLKAHKTPYGTIQMRSWSEGDLLYLEVSDDGHGLNAQQILEAAQTQGFISAEERQTLTEEQAFRLIARPGFSMLRVVTPVAGRGVGMDVVQAKVQALHGTYTIQSQPGRGTTFTLRLPRLHGPAEVELVRVGTHVYALCAGRVRIKRTVTRDELACWQRGEIPAEFQVTRVLDLQALLPRQPAYATDPEQYEILILNSPTQIALTVDECLGLALWNKPGDGQPPSVPLLDLDQLLTDV